MSIECKEIRGLLLQYADGSLASSGRQRVAGHIEACTGCTCELRFLQAIDQALDTEPMIEPDAGFAGAVMGMLPAQNRSRAFNWRNLAPWLGIYSASVGSLYLIAAALWQGSSPLLGETAGRRLLASVAGRAYELVHWVDTRVLWRILDAADASRVGGLRQIEMPLALATSLAIVYLISRATPAISARLSGPR